MKKSRFTEEKMVPILREADRTSVPEVSKKYKVSEQRIYVWRRKFGDVTQRTEAALRATLFVWRSRTGAPQCPWKNWYSPTNGTALWRIEISLT